MVNVIRLAVIISIMLASEMSIANGGRDAFSKIDGYGLWKKDYGYFDGDGKWILGAKNNWYIRIQLGESINFLKSCQAKQRIYIFGGSDKGYSCSLVSVSKFLGYSADREYSKLPTSDISSINKEIASAIKGEIAKNSEYVISVNVSEAPPKKEGTLLISTTAIPSPQWQTLAMSNSEKEIIESLINIRSIKKDNCCTYRDITGFSNSKINSLRDKEESYTTNYYLKTIVGKKTIYIAPAAMMNDGLGNQIISAVIVKDVTMKLIGFVNGELNYLGPDIDSDGFPEAIFSSGNSEGGSSECIKIFPKIQTLMSYGES